MLIAITKVHITLAWGVCWLQIKNCLAIFIFIDAHVNTENFPCGKNGDINNLVCEDTYKYISIQCP